MKCPHCKKGIESATVKQIEAYRLVYIVDCSQAEAAKVMGITQQAVSKLLHRLKKQRPELFEHEQHRINHKNLLPYNDGLQDKIIKQW